MQVDKVYKLPEYIRRAKNNYEKKRYLEDPEYKQKKKDIIKKNQELNKDRIREYKRNYILFLNYGFIRSNTFYYQNIVVIAPLKTKKWRYQKSLNSMKYQNPIKLKILYIPLPLDWLWVMRRIL